MAALEILLLYVLAPVGAATVSILFLYSGVQEALRSLPPGAIPDGGRSRLPVAYALVAAPIPLGLVLWVLADPVAQAVDAGTLIAAADAESMLFWAAAAFAFAAACSDASVAMCVRARAAGFLASDFGRILPIAVIPFTGVVFALTLNFLLLGYLVGFVPGSVGGSPASEDSVSVAIGAFEAYAVATLAFPVATLVSNGVRDLSRSGFLRAVMLLELGELPVLVGLVLGFLAIGGLHP